VDLPAVGSTPRKKVKHPLCGFPTMRDLLIYSRQGAEAQRKKVNHPLCGFPTLREIKKRLLVKTQG